MENSFGSVHWVDHDLYCIVPTHRLIADAPKSNAPPIFPSSVDVHSSGTKAPSGDLRITAVSPSYAKDCAVPPLPKPFLTLSSVEGVFTRSCHQLVRDLFSLQ